MPADSFGELFAELGFGTDIDLDALRTSIQRTDPPGGYVSTLVRDIAARNPNALGSTVVGMAAHDLEARKWLRDPAWQRALAEQRAEAAEAERQRRIEAERAQHEAERSQNPLDYMSDDEVLEASRDELDAWRQFADAQLRPLHGGVWCTLAGAIVGSPDQWIAEQLRTHGIGPPPDT